MKRHVAIAVAVGMLLCATLAEAQSQNYNPLNSILQGQAIERNMAEAEREGREQQEHYYFSPPPRTRPVPRVTNPYSPYLGLPADQAEGLVLQQLNQMQQQIDRLERRQNR